MEKGEGEGMGGDGMKARMPKGKGEPKAAEPPVFSFACLLPRSPALPSEQLHWGFIKVRLRPPHSWRPAAFQAGIITDLLTPKPIKLAQQAAGFLLSCLAYFIPACDESVSALASLCMPCQSWASFMTEP